VDHLQAPGFPCRQPLEPGFVAPAGPPRHCRRRDAHRVRRGKIHRYPVMRSPNALCPGLPLMLLCAAPARVCKNPGEELLYVTTPDRVYEQRPIKYYLSHSKHPTTEDICKRTWKGRSRISSYRLCCSFCRSLHHTRPTCARRPLHVNFTFPVHTIVYITGHKTTTLPARRPLPLTSPSTSQEPPPARV
jgi:hypothetical protein